ncbi:sterol desaturase family protein [Flagellimonas lutaonensis]|uniref:Fatty acid hydroxylase n=1 Tax=Flagellimonas lutaonensis TaxID=516051 RepID=A0A0D5YV55_9FLAO|nr:sterol desaturase family protein [Allomuricauda lutaonensis]AKA36105.1 fatty acid hydroxylase [Allomuricauda lutaonensis]
MQNSFEILIDPLAILLYMYVGLWVWESVAPAKPLPKMKYWKLRGIIFFFFNFTLASILPLVVDNHLANYQLLDLSAFNPVLGAIVGVTIYQGILYFWHRAIHRYNVLWRFFHQMHHSPERLDIPSAFYTGPWDTIMFTLIGSVSFVLILGLSSKAATIGVLFLTFLSLFQHANIKTPVWLGYFIQRPESHSLHHGRGIHRYNYSDFPIYDMVFGTFKNPEKHVEETGFYDGASSRVLDMLVMKDVSNPKEL